MKTKIIAQVTIYLLFFLVHPINNAFSRTYITYNGEIGKPIISESDREVAFERKKHEIHSANKDKIKDDLKTDVAWVRDCMAYGYLEDKGYLGITTVRALMSDISASIANLPSWDQNSINSFFKNKLDWRSKINEGEPPEWQRADLCVQYEKSFLNNMNLLANSKPPKDENIPFVAIIAPTEPKEDFLNTRNVASHALHNLYRALGIIYGKSDYFSKAKKMMNEDKVALAAFINNLPYAEFAEYDLDKIAFTAHESNKRGFFSRVGKKDWHNFMASWERFKEKGYKIRVLTVEKSSTLISLGNYFKLPPPAPVENQQFEQINIYKNGLNPQANNNLSSTSSTKGLHFEIIEDGEVSRLDSDDWNNFVSGDELIIKYKEKIKRISTSSGRIIGVKRNSIKDKEGNEYFFIQYSNGGNSGDFGLLVSSYNNELITSESVHNLFLSHDEQASYYYFRDMFPKRSPDETEAISLSNNFIENDLLVELSSELTDICDNNWCGACKTHIPSIIQSVYYDAETIHLNKLNLNEMIKTKNGRNAVLKLVEHIYSRIADNTDMGKINIDKYLLPFNYNEKNLCRAIFDKKDTEEIVQLLILLRNNQ